MRNLKSYLLMQTTDVLAAGLKANISPEVKKLMEEVLLQRQSLFNKYARKKLLDMTPAQLVELLNSPQIRTKDSVAGKTVMLEIFNVLDEKAPNADVYYSEELIAYLTEGLLTRCKQHIRCVAAVFDRLICTSGQLTDTRL